MSVESFHDGRVILHGGDCLDVLAGFDAGGVDAVVTDPPYELGFMGRTWDSSGIAFRPETWAAIGRVMKPGAHLVAFGAPKNFHRMVCAIEDAGFEIRDSISYLHDSGTAGPLLWTFGGGFPKSRNVSRDLNDRRCLCGVRESSPKKAPVAGSKVLQHQVRGGGEVDSADAADVRGVRLHMEAEGSVSSDATQDVLAGMPRQTVEHGENGEDDSGTHAVRGVRGVGLSGASPQSAQREDVLQSFLPGEGRDRADAGATRSRGSVGLDGQEHGVVPVKNVWREEPGLEGRRNAPQEARELRQRSLRPMPCEPVDDGASGRLRDGASACDGGMGQASADEGGVCSSSRPQSASERESQSGIVAVQSQSQDGGVWPHCGRCGKPIVPDGLGTALKPAYEPICLARWPLSEKTVAANVLRHGAGALNIDACRVGDDILPAQVAGQARIGTFDRSRMVTQERIGRWPANVCHDGSAEVVGAFPSSESGPPRKTKRSPDGASRTGYGAFAGQEDVIIGFGDGGSAARFFYSAKADADDRLGSRHPTVKPVDLMQWLVRMVCPPGGLILDPFAGTGTTGEAALREGRRVEMIEREAEHIADIARRMAHVFDGEVGRSVARAKARAPADADHGPLFGGQNDVAGGGEKSTENSRGTTSRPDRPQAMTGEAAP